MFELNHYGQFRLYLSFNFQDLYYLPSASLSFASRLTLTIIIVVALLWEQKIFVRVVCYCTRVEDRRLLWTNIRGSEDRVEEVATGRGINDSARVVPLNVESGKVCEYMEFLFGFLVCLLPSQRIHEFFHLWAESK